IHIARVNLHRIADPLERFRRHERGPRSKERVVYDLALFKMIQNRLAHQLYGLLGPMSRRCFLAAAEGIQITDLPQGRLRSIPSPRCGAIATHRIPGRLVLPMIVSTTESEVLLSPDDRP